jgi:LEA14-like dessication related protein
MNQAAALKNCSFTLVSVTHEQTTLGQSSFKLGLLVKNPNPVSANVHHIELELFADSNLLATGTFSEPVSVGGNGSEELSLTVTVSHLDAARALKPILSGSVREYRVDATATIRTPLGHLKHGFTVAKTTN